MMLALESDEVKVGGPIPDEKVCGGQVGGGEIKKKWVDEQNFRSTKSFSKKIFFFKKSLPC